MRPLNDYGYHAALMTAHRTFEEASRGTGRTTRMCRLVESGDVVIVPSASVSRNVQRVLRELDVRARVLTVEKSEDLFRGTAGLMDMGVIAHLEHTWIEQRVHEAIHVSLRDMTRMYEQLNVRSRS